MFTFKDLEGNTIHCRPAAVLCVITKSPLTSGSSTENLILLAGGVRAPVTHAVAMDVLAELEARQRHDEIVGAPV